MHLSPLSPDQSVVYWQNRWLSQAEVFSAFSSVSTAFLRQPSKAVLLACNDSFYFAVAFIAAAIAKKDIVLPPNYQQQTLSSLLAAGDCVLVNDESVEQALLCQASSVEEFELDPMISVTLNTSGSSGAPVSIHKRLQHLLAEVDVLQSQWPMSQQQKILGTVSHTHIYGLLYRVLWPIVSGARWYADKIDSQESLLSIVDDDCQVITSPAFLSRLDTSLATESAGRVFSSGGALGFDAALATQKAFHQAPLEVYGSTESGGIAWRQRTEEQQDWQLFDVVEATVDNESVLSVSSPYIPEQDQPMQMGDRVSLDHGVLRLLGRTDRIVKLHEKRISLTQIESLLSNTEWVEQSRVIVFQNRLAAVLVLTNQGESALAMGSKRTFVERLKAQLLNHVERVALPRRWRFVEAMPVNEQGKTTHEALTAIVSAPETAPNPVEI